MDKQDWAKKQVAVVLISYTVLVLGILLSLHYSLLPFPRFIVLYSFLAVFTLGTICWTAFVERKPLAYLGLTRQGLGKSLLLSIVLGLMAVGGMSFNRLVQEGPFYAYAVLISSLLEAVYIYSWLQTKLRELTGFTTSLILTAAFYALYHLGYFGLSSSGLDSLTLSFGLYLLTGIAVAAVYRYTNNILSIWPFFLGAGTLYDYTRLNIGYLKAGIHRQRDALPLIWFSLVLLAGVAILVAALRRKSHRAMKAPLYQTETFSPVAMSFKSITEHIKLDLKLNRRRLIGTCGVIFPLLVLGLVIRYIINDPVALNVIELMPTGAYYFILDRSVMSELTIRLGLAAYLFIPVFTLAMWHDMATRHHRVVAVLGQHGVARELAAGTGVISKAIITMCVTLGLMMAVLLFAVPLSLYKGHVPTGSDLLRYGVLTLATIVYALLNFSVFSILSYITRNKRWMWFAALLLYMFVFYWWMVYPAYSQLAASDFPSTTNTRVVAAWFAEAFARAVPLYAAVPQYHYYMLLTVTYLKNVLDPTYFLPHMSLLASYAISLSILLLAYARRATPWMTTSDRVLANGL